MSLAFLNPEEIELLTCRKRYVAQAKMLGKMRIQYIKNGRGFPLVHKSVLYPKHEKRNLEAPNFDALK